MNLILLFESDFIQPERVRLNDYRLIHIKQVHRAQVGDVLRIGLLDGLMGDGRITGLDDKSVEMEINLTTQPPPALPLTLILALPRPKMLRRILAATASLGVKKIHLINAYRVEKSFWNSPYLSPQSIRQQLILGLEQACDTVLPTIQFHKLFKPFVEDDLPLLAQNTLAFVAHPAAASLCPRGISGPALLAIGPEGGFIQYEVDKLGEAGFTPVQIGQRILRVETAVPVLLARLFDF